MSLPKLLSPDEVSDLLGVSTGTLAKWRQTGSPDLPYVRVAGRIRYRASDVDAFLDDVDEDLDEDEPDDEEDDEEDDCDED